MVYIHTVLTLYAIVPMPFITLIALRLSGRIHQRFEVVQKTFASLTERVRETIAGIRVVKAYVQEGAEREKLSSLSQEYLKRNIGVTRVWGMFFPSITLLSSLSMAIVLYFGGRLTLLRSISPGDFVAFMSYLGVLAWPMMALGWAVNLIQRGGASMDRLNRIFAEVPGRADVGRVARIDRLRGRIEMKGLTFSPENGGDPILAGLDLTVEEGERLAIVGRTGSGKTTLCNLLARVMEPSEGSILIDGVEAHRIPMDVLRRSLGYVPQDTFLFSDTLRENIAFGRLDATEEEIAEAARLAQIYDEIVEFPDGMKTVIGEKGVTLSGGQRQRIAIARAILMKPAVFILDNALSSVDLQTEERILEGLETFFRGRTSVLVTHRIAPLRKADRIAVLEGGKLVELGDHSSLLAKGGVYSDLYWREQLEEELEKENGK
jgi:ATP-binding cassette subfamily B protein